MKAGVIQQIGSPSDIYLYPANLFVADFMGSPAMNLIPARVEKNEKGSALIISRESEDDLPTQKLINCQKKLSWVYVQRIFLMLN